MEGFRRWFRRRLRRALAKAELLLLRYVLPKRSTFEVRLFVDVDYFTEFLKSMQVTGYGRVALVETLLDLEIELINRAHRILNDGEVTD